VTANSGFLVVGGDSLVGAGLVRTLARRGHRVFASTRRRDTLTPERIFLDFESAQSFRVPAGIDYAFVIAAATTYVRCETDPLAKVINIELIPRLVGALLEQGVFVTFISSNLVFGGQRPWPHEDDSHAPGIAYAWQKSEGEARIRTVADRVGASEQLNIVRLTKIMNASVPPLPAWFTEWNCGRVIEPFSDLIFAPMSVSFVGEALATIGERRVAGNLHLSGAANVTYVEFAHALARRLGVATALIQPTTAVAKCVNIPFKPRFSGLGMTRTTQLIGCKPQQLDQVVDDLAADLRR
jgi:dTDP-4-dehydrorhamnose reductase